MEVFILVFGLGFGLGACAGSYLVSTIIGRRVKKAQDMAWVVVDEHIKLMQKTRNDFYDEAPKN